MTSRCNVLLVYPLFPDNSFWNIKDVCEVVGARTAAPPLGLITVAALLPQSWTFRLVNRNAEPLSDRDLEWADVVMTGGMLFQQDDTLRIVDLAHRHGKPVVVGGPGVTSVPETYAAADFLVIGEAETIIDRFVADWGAGKRSGTYTAVKFKTDVTTTPNPRWDLLKFDHYIEIGMQFSRGCPFTCEFCDIIELYGRVPRTKTKEQVLTELDTIHALGYRGHLDFVDDNLIGNKKAVKAFLPHLIAWQAAHDFPFEFTTEASINLADDHELLGLMRDAGFFGIFVGIESPDPETLADMQKKQNTRRSLSDSILRIYNAGILVIAGLVVGFDSEKGSVEDAMVDLVEEACIPASIVSMLSALPNTQLSRRLAKEGRILNFEAISNYADRRGDFMTSGLNFVTRRPRREVLVDYRNVIERLFRPEAYFDRLRRLATKLWPPHRPMRFYRRMILREGGKGLRLLFHVMLRCPDIRGEFWRTVRLTARERPMALPAIIRMGAMYIHTGPHARYVVRRIDEQIAAIDDGTWAPELLVEPANTKPPGLPPAPHEDRPLEAFHAA